MNSFLHKPIFKNTRVSIIMILLMLTTLVCGVSKSGLLSRSAHAQGTVKSDENKPQFDLGETTQKERPLFELEGTAAYTKKPIKATDYHRGHSLSPFAASLKFIGEKWILFYFSPMAGDRHFPYLRDV